MTTQNPEKPIVMIANEQASMIQEMCVSDLLPAPFTSASLVQQFSLWQVNPISCVIARQVLSLPKQSHVSVKRLPRRWESASGSQRQIVFHTENSRLF